MNKIKKLFKFLACNDHEDRWCIITAGLIFALFMVGLFAYYFIGLLHFG